MHSRQWAEIPGWLTPAQAGVLHREAASVPAGGTVIEIGSHHGRSTVVLGGAVRDGARVVAIDPFPTDWRYGGPGTETELRINLATAGVEREVEVRVATSRAALASWRGPVDLVWIDGKHDVWSLRHDLRWAAHLEPGGRVLVHDAFSSVGVTVGLLSVLLGRRDLTYLDRTGSLARLERTTPGAVDRLRVLAELPWFARNVAVKVLLRLRLRRVAALMGHRDTADPY